jgi:hypothetical protein
MSIGSHQSQAMKSCEWYTPPYIIQALGRFDLDPCCADKKFLKTADTIYSKDGLEKEWYGRVWLNPPYGKYIGSWIQKLANHGNGICLIFARTETKFFHRFIWNSASGIFFFYGRLHFYDSNGIRAKANAGAPSCLVSYNQFNNNVLKKCSLAGKFIELKGS